MSTISQPLPKPVIKSSEMASTMTKKAIECSIEAVSQYSSDKEVAAAIRDKFQTAFPDCWHCFVGRDLVSFSFNVCVDCMCNIVRRSSNVFYL